MAQNERDELADALAAMSAGQTPAQRPPRASTRPAPAANLEQNASAMEDATEISPTPAVAAPLAAQRPRQALSAVLAQSIEYKRTLIPILLTCGLLLPLLGALPWVFSGSMIGEMPRWAIICSFLTGAVLLALAIANMIQVKHQLEKLPQRHQSPR